MTVKKAYILDYGVGNIHSISKALQRVGLEVEVLSEGFPVDGVLILPGVGAFQGAMERLGDFTARIKGWVDAGRPLLGVCIGMQVLLDSSEETFDGDGSVSGGLAPGLGIIPGTVVRMVAGTLPQIGWNSLRLTDFGKANIQRDSEGGSKGPEGVGMEHILDSEQVYFVNSFACRPVDEDVVIATYSYGGNEYPAIINSGNVWATQFHPEKSSEAGIALLGEIIRRM